MDKWERLLLYRKKLILPQVHRVLGILSLLTYASSLIFMLTMVYEYGFMVSDSELNIIHIIYKCVWAEMLLQAIATILFRSSSDDDSRYGPWMWLLYSLLFLTLLPVIFHEPEVQTPGVYYIWHFFNSPYYFKAILILMSVFALSGSLVRLMGRRTNPSLILASSFLFILMVGTGLLMLPRATINGISWIDALFTATSATCVTGLSTVDVPSVFTLEGQIIILLLIQIGGLGMMTITSFFALFFMGNTSIYNQLLVGDMISSNSLNSLLSTLLYILGFTLAIEGVGMGVIWYSVHGTMGMSVHQELYFAIFHSVSAFCNAGFSTLPGNLGNPLVMTGHNLLFIAVSALVILGGIGFPILVNIRETIVYHARYCLAWLWRLITGRHASIKGQRVHLYSLNTKIVLVMTALLLVVGTVVIAMLEWNVSLAGMPVADKWVHAFFNAVCPRTAGFCSVSFNSMTVQTLLVMLLLMVIGGGTQSTAGGIKINVFAVVMLNLKSVLRGSDRVRILHRELSADSVRRSNAVVTLYMLMLFVGVFLLSLLEPKVGILPLVFECVSALSTVGSSLDLTPTLGTYGKMLIVILMFIGRVGAFTLVIGLIKQEKKRNYRYPTDHIIIN